MILMRLLNLCLFTTCVNMAPNSTELVRRRRLPASPGQQMIEQIRAPMLHLRDSLRFGRMRTMRMMQQMQRAKTVCYGTIGCFEVPRRPSPLVAPPESPHVINTKFYLFCRKCNFSTPEILDYDNVTTIQISKYDPSKLTKIIIHGYMSIWTEEGELAGANAYLKIYDCNVILVDWANGARGPQYRVAAANTEVVGRQMGLLLLEMIRLGANPRNIHLIGFSLGAHIAGVASEFLKTKGYLLGRITALDPASPLFKHHLVRDQSRKLDISDARFVDVIHTDGSPIFTDGFGLLEPIGHVDYFPNGGREQPGCFDGRGSVVVAQLEPLNREIACSHIRAWRYYLETILNKAENKTDCRFIAYPCPKGVVGFTFGECFPTNLFDKKELSLDEKYRLDFGYLGEDAKGFGPMYLVTRNSEPYCGTQLQVQVKVSQRTQPTRGILQLQLQHGEHKTNFQIKCELLDIIPAGHAMHGISAAVYNSVNAETTKMIAHLAYQSLEFQSPRNLTSNNPRLFLDKIQVRDMFGNSWQFCAPETEIVDKRGELFEILTVELNKNPC